MRADQFHRRGHMTSDEERQAELQRLISRSALEWRLTFDAIAFPLLLVELDGRILRMNEAARDLGGVSYEGAIHHPLGVLGEGHPWRAVRWVRAERLNGLMRQLLDYGKPSRLDLGEACPHEVMTSAIVACAPLAHQAGIEIAHEADPSLPRLVVDRHRVVQIFQNLLENAIQHS